MNITGYNWITGYNYSIDKRSTLHIGKVIGRLLVRLKDNLTHW